ncbi:hypothetical protein J2Z21_009784 [Streptomyces griseochromogenes]|uniref:Uncharacterized protein n=1 Tax=Streptomyces griseochromogenes TaxID=68214 RepID=A0A1B1AX29_9ACTN|nr:hypothetical protein [Streptomyces griseochromogenes]ANP51080.1 hypothetical protein AVL59_16915 [Streptomyces griseochromogenes]MBP2056765.1 hypothetical protein [Streptomyces griseochromogenes]
MGDGPVKPYTFHADGTAVNTVLVLHWDDGEDLVLPIDSAHWLNRANGETELEVTIPGHLVRVVPEER